MSASVERRVARVGSPFQLIEVIDTHELGRMLFLDGHVQLATFDEHAYHEPFVHVPLWAARGVDGGAARRALVVGGGDGGVLRELARHRSLEVVDMVEIDDLVVSTCREHLPELSGGAFDDPRVKVFIEDAFAFVKHGEGLYDLIVVDATDVYEEEDGSLSEMLFTEEFYADCARRLSPGGVVVTQADNPVFCAYSAAPVLDLYRRVFGNAGFYWSLVPSFGGYSGFVWGSRGSGPALDWPEPDFAGELRYLNLVTYGMGLGRLPFGALSG